MTGFYPSIGLVAVLAVSLLAGLLVFFRRRRRRNEFPAETWDPYLDSGEGYDPDDADGGIEIISGAEGAARDAGVSSYEEPVSSRLKNLEKFPPEMREEEVTDSLEKEGKAPFGFADEAPAPPPESEYSGEAGPRSPEAGAEMMDFYPSVGLVSVLAVVLLAVLWAFFRRRRRRNEFPAETWDPYLDSGDRDSPDDAVEGIEMISGAEGEARDAGIASSGAPVFSRLKDLEKFPPEMKEEELADALEEREEAPFGFPDKAPASPPENEYSGEAGPLYSPDEPEGDLEEERKPAAEAFGGGGFSAPTPGEAAREIEEKMAGSAEGKSPWWKDAAAPKDRPFLRGVAELMGVTILDSVKNLEIASTAPRSPESTRAEEPVDTEVAETILEPETGKVPAPAAAFTVSGTEEALDSESGEESPEETFALEAKEAVQAFGLEEDAPEAPVVEEALSPESPAPERPEEVAEETAGALEPEEDVFSVIGEERGGGHGELPEESIGSAGLFDVLEDEETPAAPEEAEETVAPVAEEAVSLEDIVDETLSSEPMDTVQAAPVGAEKEAERPVSHGDGEADAGEEPEAAVPLPGGSPLEVVRELVATLCPGDLILIEEIPERLPDGAAEAAAAAWSELREQLDERKTVAPEEFLRLGILDQFAGRYDEAMTRLKEALRRTDRMGPVLNAMAVASYLRGKIDPAISYCKEAVREAGEDAPLSAAIYRNVGFLYQQRGDIRPAAEALVASIRHSGPEEDPRILGELHLRAGQLFRKLGDVENAQQHYTESSEFFGRSGDKMFRIRSLVALAASQTEQDDVDGALRNLDEAARLCAEEGDKTGEALTLGQMGIAYSAQDQYTRAIEHFGKALTINRELGNRRGEGATLSNIGNIHYFRGDLDEARTAYEEALEINREQSHLVGQATILGNLGRIHLEGGETDAARECLHESLDLFRTAGAKSQLDRIHEMLDELERTKNS